ncbi:hypothetical protein D1007_09445 [Hordeum vulgare]|nr:hypothetical protein D1007_09445 [Hordeum vulgare]
MATTKAAAPARSPATRRRARVSGSPRRAAARTLWTRRATRGQRRATGRCHSGAAPCPSRSTPAASGSASRPRTPARSARPTCTRPPTRGEVAVDQVWDGFAVPEGFHDLEPHSYVVHLGDGRLCVAKFFETTRQEADDD